MRPKNWGNSRRCSKDKYHEFYAVAHKAVDNGVLPCELAAQLLRDVTGEDLVLAGFTWRYHFKKLPYEVVGVIKHIQRSLRDKGYKYREVKLLVEGFKSSGQFKSEYFSSP